LIFATRLKNHLKALGEVTDRFLEIGLVAVDFRQAKVDPKDMLFLYASLRPLNLL
jgi:hypothetical protein